MSFFRSKSSNSLGPGNSTPSKGGSGTPSSSPVASRKASPQPMTTAAGASPAPFPASGSMDRNDGNDTSESQTGDSSLSVSSGSPEKSRKGGSGFLGLKSRSSSSASLASGSGGKKDGLSATAAAGSSKASRDKGDASAAAAKGSTTTQATSVPNDPNENAEELPREMTGKQWKPRPGHPGNLSPAQSSALLQLTGALSDEKTLPSHGAFTPEELEVHLCRFLRARNWNVPQAKEMWNKSYEWKKSVDLDRLMQEFSFDEREKVAKAGWQMYFHKVDRLGRPIFVQDLAGLEPNVVWTVTTPDRIVHNFAVTLEDAVRNRYSACTKARVGIDGRLIEDNLMILDVQGLGMSTFWNFKSQLQQLLSILDNNFPELSGRVQIINAPWLFSTIWSYLKGWLPPNTVDKIDITGADYQGILLQFIDAENLPAKLGGKCVCKEGCNLSDEGPWKEQTRGASAADSQ